MIYINKTVMARKKIFNKNEMIVASSLIAIPLTAVLIAMVTRRSRNRAAKRRLLSREASSETNTITKDTATSASISITHNHHRQERDDWEEGKKEQEEEVKAPSQSEYSRQESESVEEMPAAPPVTITTTLSANTTSTDKDITNSAPLVVVVPSPMEPSNSIEKAMMPSPSRTPSGEQELSVSDEARKAGESLKELIVAAINGAKESAKGTGKRLKEETIDIADTTDSKDIQSLGDNVNTLVGLFEKTMVEIRKEHYNEQIKLLQSYKDLLHTQLKVVRARGMMASKLKPGA
jgi:hypothetical protein